jgi:hypothetical protein
MAIHFDAKRLPGLYEFKKDTIQLCIEFIKEVIKSSSKSKMKCGQKIKDIETDLYDIFCRWNFNAIQSNLFDFETFLPTGPFIMMIDLAYYLRRFQLELHDSLVTFPFDQFELIREKAKRIQVSNETQRPINCSEVQETRLQTIYQGSDFEKDKKNLLQRYYYLGGLNNSLSTPPPVLSLFTSHELFGTPFNTCSPQFCSPFRDEKVFGSSGSFFEFDDFKEDTVYFANPPFDDPFCDTMADRLLSQLSKKKFSLIVIIPVWDNIQQEKHGLKNFGLPFRAYNKLIESPYFLSETFLPKDNYPFFNYFYNRYVYISNTHVINLGIPVDVDLLVKTWTQVKK